MNKLKFSFWALVVSLAGVIVYKSLLRPSDQGRKFLDPAKKAVQSLLARAEEKIPKEISVEVGSLAAPAIEEKYHALKRRNLFARFQVSAKALPKTDKKIEETVKPKKEEPPVFVYKGTLQLAGKQAVILQETGGRSFFVGKGDRIPLKSGEIEYEVVDITADEVIISTLDPKEESRIPKSVNPK